MAMILDDESGMVLRHQENGTDFELLDLDNGCWIECRHPVTGVKVNVRLTGDGERVYVRLWGADDADTPLAVCSVIWPPRALEVGGPAMWTGFPRMEAWLGVVTVLGPYEAGDADEVVIRNAAGDTMAVQRSDLRPVDETPTPTA